SARGLGDTTLGDLGRGLRRYSPFLVALAVVVAAVNLLPGASSPPSGAAHVTMAGGRASSGGGAVTPAGSGTAGGGSDAGATGPLATASGAVVGAVGPSGGGAGPGSSGGGSASAPAAAPPVSTADPYCDRATGRVMMPTLFAAPCEPSYTGDNGGATYPGVTSDTITVAVWEPGPGGQAESTALAKAAGDTDTQAQFTQTEQDYVDLFEHHVQTYGRKIKLVPFQSSLNTADSTAAQTSECQSDATKVAKVIKAFISWGDCAGINSYEQTLASDGVLCFCSVSIPYTYYLKWAPYVWGTGLPDEEQGHLMREEMICNEIAPFPPKFAGEADLNYPLQKQRRFGYVWPGPSATYNTTIYEAGSYAMWNKLKACGADMVDMAEYPILDPNGPADAETLMAKFKADHVTDVIVDEDPIDPIYLSTAADNQAYYPEWIQIGTALTDSSHESRNYDQKEWAHNFGISFLPDRVPQTSQDPYVLYQWAFHHAPPAADSYAIIEVFPFFFTLGVSLAGPDLTPRSFQCGEPPYTSQTHSGWLGASSPIPCVGKTYKGLFGYPISPTNYTGRVANSVISCGSKLWPWDDYNMYDDGVLLWWDAKATGPDDTNQNGTGLYRYMDAGKRYLYGQLPPGDQPWFDPANTVTVFGGLPGPDVPPSYPVKCYYLCDSPGY
ncbi:MAG TPA: hypothetical protein VFH70_12495, partial [Acidimicrobiales bacterium]|nr:hypothetical protein [Acidimicrobiales bacterium]